MVFREKKKSKEKRREKREKNGAHNHLSHLQKLRVQNIHVMLSYAKRKSLYNNVGYRVVIGITAKNNTLSHIERHHVAGKRRKIRKKRSTQSSFTPQEIQSIEYSRHVVLCKNRAA